MRPDQLTTAVPATAALGRAAGGPVCVATPRCRGLAATPCGTRLRPQARALGPLRVLLLYLPWASLVIRPLPKQLPRALRRVLQQVLSRPTVLFLCGRINYRAPQ